MTTQTKEAQKHAAIPGSGEEKAPRLKTETQWFYCGRLQQQRREKAAVSKREESKMPTKARS